MAFNLSSSVPAPPTGRHDLQYQSDGMGNISVTDSDGIAEILTTKGDIPVFGTVPDRLPAGADNTFVAYDSGQPLGISTRALVAGDIPAIPESRVTNLVSDLALKAPLASPALTGVPTAPTASTPTNTTQIATTAYVQAQGYITSASALAKYTTSWSSQTSVTVTHGLSTTAVIVQVFDAGGVLVIPESVTVTSSSVVTLTFGAAFSGSVVVIG